MNQTIRSWLQVAEKVRFEGDPVTPDDLDLDVLAPDVSVAVDWWRQAQIAVAAAKAVEQATAQHLASLLGDGGATRAGNDIIRYKTKRTERCIDPEGAADYLTHEIVEGRIRIADLVNPQYVKRSCLDPAVRDTFFEWVDGEPSIQTMPVEKAPKFLQTLADGETVV